MFRNYFPRSLYWEVTLVLLLMDFLVILMKKRRCVGWKRNWRERQEEENGRRDDADVTGAGCEFSSMRVNGSAQKKAWHKSCCCLCDSFQGRCYCNCVCGCVCVCMGGTAPFWRVVWGVGWWVGCIKLPYGRLSGVTEPKGFLLFFLTEGGKRRKRGGGGLTGENLDLFFFLDHSCASLQLYFRVNTACTLTACSWVWNSLEGKLLGHVCWKKKATPQDFIIIKNCWSTLVFIMFVVIVNLLWVNNFLSET